MASYGSIPQDDENTLTHRARNAFQNQDIELSKQVHEQKRLLAGTGEQHSTHGGDLVKAIVFGGLDGIITTFATVTSVYGAEMSPTVILVLGIAHLFADGVSMGMGNFLGDQAEMDHNKRERARECWEVDHNLQGEKEEMYEIYEGKNVSPEDARLIVDTMAKYRDVFVDTMMFEELTMIPVDPDEDIWSAAMPNAVATFLSFVIFGAVPLVSYLFDFLSGGGSSTSTGAFNFSLVLTVVTLYLLGFVRGRMTGLNANWSGIVIALNGSFAALIGFLIGYAMKNAMGLKDGDF